MAIRTNKYNDPAIGAIFSDLAGLFAPPGASDMANYAVARQRNQQADIVESLRKDPRYQGADAAILADLYDWNNSHAAMTMGDATARRGQDVTAQTAITTNAADNQTALALPRFSPMSPGEMLPEVDATLAEQFGLPSMSAVQGNPKPFSETEQKARERQQLIKSGDLSMDDILAAINSDIPVENVVGEGGAPVVTRRSDAVGREPAYNPNAGTTVNLGPNGVDYGDPGDGLAWARNPDNSVKLDERGAPIALPFQGGKRWDDIQAAEARAASDEQSTNTKGNIVLQEVDRALAQIGGNPWATTGFGSQVSSWLGGTPAKDVASLVDTIKANTGFDQLQALREASPTGGALGPVSDRENQLLQAVLGSVDPQQSDGQLIDNLKRVANVYLDIIHGEGKGPPREKLSFPSQWDPYTAPAAAPATATPPFAAPAIGEIVDGYKFKGGDPADQASWQLVLEM